MSVWGAITSAYNAGSTAPQYMAFIWFSENEAKIAIALMMNIINIPP
jgi:hypothetical protein